MKKKTTLQFLLQNFLLSYPAPAAIKTTYTKPEHVGKAMTSSSAAINRYSLSFQLLFDKQCNLSVLERKSDNLFHQVSILKAGLSTQWAAETNPCKHTEKQVIQDSVTS